MLLLCNPLLSRTVRLEVTYHANVGLQFQNKNTSYYVNNYAFLKARKTPLMSAPQR